MKTREKFLLKLNEAFAECDSGFIAKSVTDDIKWVIVGERVINGRDEFEEALENMKEGGPMKIKIKEIITMGNRAVVEGTVRNMVEPGKPVKYSFCDIYFFEDDESDKVQELRTYVANLKKRRSFT